MKFIAVVLAFAFAGSFAGPARSQAAKPKPAPAVEAAKPESKPAPVAAHKSRRNQDARQCLELPSNEEIIKCAEAYL
jgi:hypothetical protein